MNGLITPFPHSLDPQRARRIWMVDRQAAFIGEDHHKQLGDWSRRRLKAVAAKEEDARKRLSDCGISVDQLRIHWEEQREAQLSIRARQYCRFSYLLLAEVEVDAPVRLKKELDAVLTLQGDLDTIDKALSAAKATFAKSPHSKEVQACIRYLQNSQEEIQDKVEALYASLNVHESFPELDGVDFDFVRTLLMARDLKINIRKRAIGTFFEFDKLDQAAAGRNNPLGTLLFPPYPIPQLIII